MRVDAGRVSCTWSFATCQLPVALCTVGICETVVSNPIGIIAVGDDSPAAHAGTTVLIFLAEDVEWHLFTSSFSFGGNGDAVDAVAVEPPQVSPECFDSCSG